MPSDQVRGLLTHGNYAPPFQQSNRMECLFYQGKQAKSEVLLGCFRMQVPASQLSVCRKLLNLGNPGEPTIGWEQLSESTVAC